MEKLAKLRFLPFTEDDVNLLTYAMKSAFDADGIAHLGRPAGPEGYEDGSFLRKYALDPGSDAYTVWLGQRAIGAAIVWPEAADTAFLGCVFLEAGYQKRGIGTQILRFLEAQYPQVRVRCV